MEKFSNFESEKNPENVGVEILKEKGPQSEEFGRWVEEQESEANSINTSRASLDLSNRLARVYYKAGYTKEAIDSLYDNREAANAEGAEILAEIDTLLDKMEAGEEIL